MPNNDQITSITQSSNTEDINSANMSLEENFTIAPLPKDEHFEDGGEKHKSEDEKTVDSIADDQETWTDEKEIIHDGSKKIDKTIARPGVSENDKIDTITDPKINKEQEEGDTGENLFIENWTKENKVKRIF